MDIPQKWGGLELDKKTMAIIYEEMAKIDAGFTLSFSVAANEWQRVAASNWTNEISRSYFGVYGEPIITVSGYTTVKIEYNEMGECVQVRYFNADGNEVYCMFCVPQMRQFGIDDNGGST